MIRKSRLMTPGPAPVHPEAGAAGVGPLPHHRSAAFKPRFAAVQEGLCSAFRTEGPVAVLASSGTGAMEAALVNLFSDGDRVVVLAGGKFGHRWAEVAEAYGMRVKTVHAGANHMLTVDDAAEAVAAFRPVSGLVMTASETSTGAAVDVAGIAAATRRLEADAAIVVDAITAVGAFPIETDAWGLDAVCGGSQKAFMIPPGLGFVACSPRGWERIHGERAKPRYYFDLRKYARSAGNDQTPFTPATGLIVQLQAALDVIADAGGIDTLEDNAQALAAATRAAAKALELDLLSPESPSPAVTAIRAPRSGVAPDIVAAMRERHDLFIAAGQGDLKPDIFRIGHLGYIDAVDLLGTLATLERVLTSIDYQVRMGASVAAASAVLDARG